MLSLNDCIELLERDLQAAPPAFTMSTDLPFAIFRYDPEDEWLVRKEIHKLAIRVQNTTGKTVTECSLATLYWKSIEESEGIQEIVELEKLRGFVAAEDQVSEYLSDPDWRPLTDLIVEATHRFDPASHIVFFLRAGVFAPSSYRISSLLEQLMGRMRVPSVLFYPGSWRNESLNYMNLRSDEQSLGSYRVKIYGRG